VARLVPLVPRPLASGIGALVGRALAHRASAQRQVLEENLARVVPGISTRARARLVARSYASYGRYWADAACLSPRDADPVRHRIEFEGRERFDELRQDGSGVILALPHVGIWDAGGLWGLQDQFRVVTVAEPTADPELFEWFVQRRRRLGLEVYAPGAATASALLHELAAGTVVALLADRDVLGDGIEVPFFGGMTRVPAGPAVLALRSGAPLIPVAVYQAGAGRFRIVLRQQIDTTRQGTLRQDVRRVAAALMAEFAEFVRAAPEQWHVLQPVWREDAWDTDRTAGPAADGGAEPESRGEGVCR
jgi:KDO2-lipid IV(A) lauroyltransferase